MLGDLMGAATSMAGAADPGAPEAGGTAAPTDAPDGNKKSSGPNNVVIIDQSRSAFGGGAGG